jgi:hypothetical protein
VNPDYRATQQEELPTMGKSKQDHRTAEIELRKLEITFMAAPTSRWKRPPTCENAVGATGFEPATP